MVTARERFVSLNPPDRLAFEIEPSVTFVITVPLSKIQLLHDVGNDKDYASIDGRCLSVPVTFDEWERLEMAGTDVPINERRHHPFYGPVPFCVTHSGRYDGHAKYVSRHRDGHLVCSFCYRSPNETPAGMREPVKRKPRKADAR